MEPALARQHGIPDPGAHGQILVESGHEAAGGLHQYTVAHGDYRGHAHL